MLNPLFSPEFRESLADKLRPTMSFISDLVTKIEQQTNEGRVICALCDVKNSHGPARREALHNLDRVVTELFPPVEGAPLPSEELNGKADVYLDCFLMPREKSGLASCFHDALGPSTEYRFFLKNKL